jgi:hypothetical protein
MKHLILLSLLGSLFFGCHSDNQSNTSTKVDTAVKTTAPAAAAGPAKLPDTAKDKADIQNLVRQMLKWADAKKGIDLLPVLVKDSICTGFDMAKEKQTLAQLRRSGFFADEFINNYDHIIRTLDHKIRNKEFEPWNVGDLPTFNFDNDVDPWCDCPDNLSWDKVEVEVVNLGADKGELKWNWGKPDAGTDPSWKDFFYKFRVVKVDNQWKISYLQGFDYQESIK